MNQSQYVAELEQENESLRQELTTARDNLKREKEACGVFSKEKNKLTFELNENKNDLISIKERYALLEQEIQRLKATNKDLERQIDTLKSRKVSLSTFSHALRNSNS